ncbi:UNVERIFIED_CONTAM: hypothetical protein PYX00_000657 [Menopon gallinae]
MESFHDRVFPNISPGRRSRKLAVVGKFTGIAKTEKSKENGNAVNGVRALIYNRTNDPFISPPMESDAVKSPASESVSSVKNCRRDPGKAKKEAAGVSNENPSEEAKTCSPAPVEIHDAPTEETVSNAAADHGGKSVEYSNLSSIPNISTSNLLEEIEADLPSSYSLANMLDHTFHSITNLRTCARLSRVGTNLAPTDESTRKVKNSESDINNHLKYLQKQAFIQKTIIDQADKAVKLCKVRKKQFDPEDLETLKILLLAKLRYDVINLELQNFKLNGRDWKEDHFGEISISEVYFTVNDMPESESGHFVFIAFHKEHFFASHIEGNIRNGKLHFPVSFKFECLNQNFIVYLELYKLTWKVKSKEQSKAFDLRKLKTMASQFASKESVHNGDQRDFFCVGSATLRLNDVKRREGGKVMVDFHTVHSYFGKKLNLNLRVCAYLNSRMNGFLNVFKNTFWHRMWCCQSDYYLHFWTYPEDKDNGKAPVDSIFLPRCRQSVLPVSMDVCIRPHSFTILFKGHENDLLLSASSNREMMNWISHLEAAIRHFEAWAPDF